MPAGYSKEIRFLALQQLFKGRPVAEVATATGVAERTLQTWMKEAKAEKRYAPKPAGRPRRSKLDDHLDYILEVHVAEPGISVRELRAKLEQQRNVTISLGALWDYLERTGLTIQRRAEKS